MQADTSNAVGVMNAKAMDLLAQPDLRTMERYAARM